MKVKMVDVARHLGISKATVSLAVNGKPGVNEQTRQKVLECIKELENNGGVLPENSSFQSPDAPHRLIKVLTSTTANRLSRPGAGFVDRSSAHL